MKMNKGDTIDTTYQFRATGTMMKVVPGAEVHCAYCNYTSMQALNACLSHLQALLLRTPCGRSNPERYAI